MVQRLILRDSGEERPFQRLFTVVRSGHVSRRTSLKRILIVIGFVVGPQAVAVAQTPCPEDVVEPFVRATVYP